MANSHRITGLIAALGLVLAACGGQPAASTQPSATAAAATSASPSASASSTPSAPSLSGSITVYGALTKDNGDAFVKAFTAKYPQTKVEMVTAGTGPLVTRIESERKAGGVKADVILLADPTVMITLNGEGILSSFSPAGAKDLPAGLKGDGWVGAFTFNNVIIYRTGTSPAPADWSDLTKADYKGKIEIGDPAYSGTTLGMVGYLSGKLGWDYFKALAANGARATQSTNTVGTDVASGAMAAGITLDSVANVLVDKGSPVTVVWPTSGAIPVPAPIAIVKGHENDVSKAFAEWLLSTDGQKTIVGLGLAPAIGTSPKIPANAKKVDVDWAKIAADRQTILDQFKSVFQ